MKREATETLVRLLTVGAVVLFMGGCSSISENTRAYLTSPHYAATDPAHVAILSSEPSRPREKLGEINLLIEGSPSREAVEKRLRRGGARLGADAVVVVYDKLHIFPIVYVDPWWGAPASTSQSTTRNVVGLAIKYK